MFLESKHSDPQGHWGTDGKGIPIREMKLTKRLVYKEGMGEVD